MQPHSWLLKFTPTQALINLASCALNAVYSNNIVANRAQPSLHTHTHTFLPVRDRQTEGGREREKQLQSEPPACTSPDKHLYWVKDESKPDSSARHGRIGFRLYTSLWSFRKNHWLRAKREEITRTQTRSPNLTCGPSWRWHVPSYRRRSWRVIGTEHKIRRQARWNSHTHMTTAFDKVPRTSQITLFGRDATFLETSGVSLES